MTSVVIRRGKDVHRGERPCDDEAQIGGMKPQTKEHQGLVAFIS